MSELDKKADAMSTDIEVLQKQTDAHNADSMILIPQSGSSANAIILAFTNTQYKRLSFRASVVNTGNATINSLPFLNFDGGQIAAGGIVANKVYDFYYDSESGGKYFLIN